MQVERVQVNTSDPSEVYHVVRSHLRGQKPARTSEQPPSLTAAASMRGLAGQDFRTARRAIAGSSSKQPPPRDPNAEGVAFYDKCANRFIERYWRRIGLWTEFISLTAGNEQAGAYPPLHMVTSADTYGAVSVEVQIDTVTFFGGTKTAYLLTHYSQGYPSALTAYVFLYEFDTGTFQYTRFENGTGIPLVSGNIGIKPAPLIMQVLHSPNNQVAAYVGATQVFSKVTDGFPLPNGAVGLGADPLAVTMSSFRCTPQ